MEPLPTGCSGVDVKHPSQFGHSFDTKDVAVTADENIRWIAPEGAGHPCVPSLGAPADVRHPDPQPLNREPVVLRKLRANRRTIHIAIHGANRGKPPEAFDDLAVSAHVAGMENQVDVLKNVVNLVGIVAVRVGENA